MTNTAYGTVVFASVPTGTRCEDCGTGSRVRYIVAGRGQMSGYLCDCCSGRCDHDWHAEEIG